jgi:DNA sulfur modification protein DndD
MILRKITLENFRQFYGTQVIEVAPPGDHNVTLIHAENGVGKTTLLNSVLWTFFDKTTDRFEQREKIVNFEAEAEGAPRARVEIEFENAGELYMAARELRATRGGYKKSEFQVVKVLRNGTRSTPLEHPEQFVHSVIPQNMAKYFFFDGEQAEAFSAETNYKEVGAAIRDILGCLLLETAKGDLEYLAKTYDKELGELEGEELISAKERDIDDLQGKIDERQLKIKEATTTIDGLSIELNNLVEGLRKAAESAALQASRDGESRLLKDCEDQIAECESEIVRWIGAKGLAIVSERLINQTLEFVNAEALRGRIPSPYNEDFVDNLLKAQRCICDRSLAPGSVEWRAVQSLLQHAANAEAMNRVVRVRSRMGALKEAREDAPHLLLAHQTKLAGLSGRRAQLQQSVEDLSRKLEGLPVAELKEREQARARTARLIELGKIESAVAETEAVAYRKDVDRIRREVNELAVENKLARKLILRRDVALATARRLVDVLVHYEKEAREEIQKEVNRILARVARRDYRLEIGDNFELRMVYANGRQLPKSGGENQLMSLAFIAALVQFAQRRSEDKANALFVPATVAPLILDSPFGQLDDLYRADTASFVPEMAPQVVLLVSSSQGKAEVLDALRKRVGGEYVLVAENRGPKGDKRQEFLTVRGRRVATTIFNCDKDLTRIERMGIP